MECHIKTCALNSCKWNEVKTIENKIYRGAGEVTMKPRSLCENKKEEKINWIATRFFFQRHIMTNHNKICGGPASGRRCRLQTSRCTAEFTGNVISIYRHEHVSRPRSPSPGPNTPQRVHRDPRGEWSIFGILNTTHHKSACTVTPQH